MLEQAALNSSVAGRGWRLVFQPVGDVPIAVSATVDFVPGLGRTGAGAMYWMLRVADIAD
ncbi:MAG TPA: hypothetical protein VII52_00090 [Gemmatimonadaceae bacterium]